MARFYDLTVTALRKTIRDAVVVTLQPDAGDATAFEFRAGQYLTFRRDFDGIDLRRSYSICAGPDDGVLQVGIKRVAGGAFSTYANCDLRIGDKLSVMPPMGRFTIDPTSEPAPATMTQRHYLGFAGGSGITPVLAILRNLLVREPGASVTLVYANRGVNTIMFREELEDLKNIYIGRLVVIHVLESDAQEVELFTGRVDEDKCAALFARLIDVGSVDTAFICGPEPMMRGIVRALEQHGLNPSRIKFELFASGQPGQARQKAQVTQGADITAKLRVSITIDGATRTFDADKDQRILDIALGHALDAPFSCRAGVCSTCRCRVIEGEVEMAANHALEDYEVRRGYVLSCQAYAISDRIVVDYDQ